MNKPINIASNAYNKARVEPDDMLQTSMSDDESDLGALRARDLGDIELASTKSESEDEQDTNEAKPLVNAATNGHSDSAQAVSAITEKNGDSLVRYLINLFGAYLVPPPNELMTAEERASRMLMGIAPLDLCFPDEERLFLNNNCAGYTWFATNEALMMLAAHLAAREMVRTGLDCIVMCIQREMKGSLEMYRNRYGSAGEIHTFYDAPKHPLYGPSTAVPKAANLARSATLWTDLDPYQQQQIVVTYVEGYLMKLTSSLHGLFYYQVPADAKPVKTANGATTPVSPATTPQNASQSA